MLQGTPPREPPICYSPVRCLRWVGVRTAAYGPQLADPSHGLSDTRCPQNPHSRGPSHRECEWATCCGLTGGDGVICAECWLVSQGAVSLHCLLHALLRCCIFYRVRGLRFLIENQLLESQGGRPGGECLEAGLLLGAYSKPSPARLGPTRSGSHSASSSPNRAISLVSPSSPRDPTPVDMRPERSQEKME